LILLKCGNKKQKKQEKEAAADKNAAPVAAGSGTASKARTFAA